MTKALHTGEGGQCLHRKPKSIASPQPRLLDRGAVRSRQLDLIARALAHECNYERNQKG